MAQAVRVREQPAERARVEPAAADGEEERVVRAARELRPRVAQVARDEVRGLLAERHDALLAALPADAHVLLLEVDVAEVEADRLRAPEAGGVDELEEGAVAEAERAVTGERVEDRLDLRGLRRLRQPLGSPWPERRVGRASVRG